MRNRQVNTNVEEINYSINNLVNQWGISVEDNFELSDKIIGLQIKKIRLIRGKTLTKCGNALGISYQQVQKYEKGINTTNPIALLMLSEYLTVSIDYFFQPFIDNNLTFLKRRDNNVYPFKTEPYLAR
jgi:hypothetical protein